MENNFNERHVVFILFRTVESSKNCLKKCSDYCEVTAWNRNELVLIHTFLSIRRQSKTDFGTLNTRIEKSSTVTKMARSKHVSKTCFRFVRLEKTDVRKFTQTILLAPYVQLENTPHPSLWWKIFDALTFIPNPVHFTAYREWSQTCAVANTNKVSKDSQKYF